MQNNDDDDDDEDNTNYEGKDISGKKTTIAVKSLLFPEKAHIIL